MTNELTVRREINPANWQMIEAIAKATARAASEQAKIAKHLLFCFENELPLSLAVNGGLYTVNNRVEVEGTVIRAQIRKHPNYDYKITQLDERVCKISIFEFIPHEINANNESVQNGWDLIGVASFTWDDVIAADLQDKENYKKYPTDMLLNRATSRAYKRFCPDIFMQSVYVRGEISDHDAGVDVIEVDGIVIPSIGEMMETNPQGVLDALNNTDGSQQAVYEYLQEVE